MSDEEPQQTKWFEMLWPIYDPPETDRVEVYIETASTTPSPAQNQSGFRFHRENHRVQRPYPNQKER